MIFDKEKGITKINDRFHFEKEIFVDRALDINKEAFIKIREKVQKLRAIVSSYESAISRIKNFNSSGINLIEILSQSANFLISQKEKPGIELEGKEAELERPTFFGFSDEKSLDLSTGLLEKYRESLEKRLNELQTCLDNLNKEIEDSYSNLRQHKYRLLSILMHEGSAGRVIIVYVFGLFFKNMDIIIVIFVISNRICGGSIMIRISWR